MGQDLTHNDWQRINTVFDKLTAAEPETWSRLIKAANLTPGLVTELQALLDAHLCDDGFLSKPLVQIRCGPERDRQLTGNIELTIDETYGDFRIIRLIGSGSFANVYLAEQFSLGRKVALKVSRNECSEARTLAALDHQGIVPVYSQTVQLHTESYEGGRQFLCMAYIPGTPLNTVIDSIRKISPHERTGAAVLAAIEEAELQAPPFNQEASSQRQLLAASSFEFVSLWIARRLGEALSYAHDRKVLHLDIKPANILLHFYGHPMLLDFNVSAIASKLSMAEIDHLGGTLKYMSPEQRRAFDRPSEVTLKKVDSRTDIYSLGLVIEELLFAKPLGDPSEDSLVLTNFTRDITTVAGKVVDRCLEIDPEKRWQSAGELTNALKTCLKLHKMWECLPPVGRLEKWLSCYPYLVLASAMLLPQLFGSIFNITYNALRIGPGLSKIQQASFVAAILPYNLIFYPLGIAVLVPALRHLARCINRDNIATRLPPAKLVEQRRFLLKTSRYLVVATSLGWLPGIVLFPSWISLRTGPVDYGTLGHFAISFFTSWLVALTYSALCLESIVVQGIYPRLWSAESDIGKESTPELRAVLNRIRICQIMAGVIPLIGAVIVVSSGPHSMAEGTYRVFQYVVTGMIVLGITGFFVAQHMVKGIEAVVTAFSMPSEAHGMIDL